MAATSAARTAGARVVGVERSGRQLEGTELTIRDFTDPALAAWLMEQGIDSVSLNPDSVLSTWLSLAGEPEAARA